MKFLAPSFDAVFRNMGDIEDAMDEDSFTEAEGEYVYSDSKSQLKMLAISAGRQVVFTQQLFLRRCKDSSAGF